VLKGNGIEHNFFTLIPQRYCACTTELNARKKKKEKMYASSLFYTCGNQFGNIKHLHIIIFFVFMPSVSMVLQNGQAAAITSGCNCKASSVRSILIRLLPGSSSLNICAPPAPQHKPLLRQRFISTSSASSSSSTFSWRFINMVGAAEIATIVVSNFFPLKSSSFFQLYFFLHLSVAAKNVV